MTNSDLLAILSKIKRNSFKMIPNKDINSIVASLNDESIVSLVPGIHDDIDLIIFKYCFYSKKDLPSQLNNIEPYLRFLNSWYDVDQCLAYITAPIDYGFYLPFFKRYSEDTNPFVRRLAYVILLKSDLKDESICTKVKDLIKEDEDSSVRMAEGWLLSLMVIENTSYMLNLFKDNSLPYSIVRIGISKSLDSYRVSPEDKLRLRMIRKNLFSLQKKDDPSDPPSEE